MKNVEFCKFLEEAANYVPSPCKSSSYELGEGLGPPSNTMSPGPTPTSVLNGIFIHPAVWPQQIWAKIGGCAPFGGGAG